MQYIMRSAGVLKSECMIPSAQRAISVKHDESIHKSALDLPRSCDTKTQIFTSLLLDLKRLCDFKIR